MAVTAVNGRGQMAGPEGGPRAKASASRLSFMLRALRYPNYRLFYGGQIVSLMGTWMTQIATTWLVYRITNSALLLGAVGFAGQVPAFLLSPIAGVWVDRWNRRRLLVVTQTLAMIQSFLLAWLALTHLITIWHIVGLLAFQGLINAFDMPGRQTFVIELIENKEDLSNAIALNSSMFNIARLVGPAVGGVLIAAMGQGENRGYLGEGRCFLIDGFSYLGVIACLLAMKVKPGRAVSKRGKPLHELKEGYRYAFGFPPIRAILILMAAMSLIGMPYGILMPVIARDTLHGGAHTLGFLMGASGMGALGAALVLAARRSIIGLGRVIPLSAMSFGVALLAFSQADTLWLALPLLFAAGFTMMQQNAACNTMLQTIVDSDIRGRVMSLYTMAFMGMAPLGSLWAGALASRIGAPQTLWVSGIGSIFIGGWFWLQLPRLRESIRPIYQQLGILPAVALAVEEEAELSCPPERVA